MTFTWLLLVFAKISQKIIPILPVSSLYSAKTLCKNAMISLDPYSTSAEKQPINHLSRQILWDHPLKGRRLKWRDMHENNNNEELYNTISIMHIWSAFFNWLHGVNDSKIESISNQWGSSANTVVPPNLLWKDICVGLDALLVGQLRINERSWQQGSG